MGGRLRYVTGDALSCAYLCLWIGDISPTMICLILAFLHPGDLTIWELLKILALSAFMLLAFVGLPLFLIGFIIHKVAEHRRDMAATKVPDSR